MAKTHILFDLDGTLTDPGIGITNSVMYALDKFGIKASDRQELFPFIGPPLIDSFMGLYGFSHADAERAVAYYREYFGPTGLYENELYGGIHELLSKLKADGYILALATSKPEIYAKEILSHFDLLKYFDFLFGATMDESRNNKNAVIEYGLGTANIDPECAVMVGDRHYDILGAKKFGLSSVGVLYGYGDEKELCEAGADMIASTPEELYTILKNM